MSKYDYITEILKFNPYHGKDGRFTSANGGGAGISSGPVKTDKYEEMLPKNSYLETPECKALLKTFRDSDQRFNAAFEEHKNLREELKAEGTPKPRSEWTTDDLLGSLMGDRPMSYTERGKEIKAQMEEKKKEYREAEKERNRAGEKLAEIKEEAHKQQAAEHEYTMPKKATQTEYEGFKTDETGTSHGNDLLRKGYLAEMSPKEYISRCAYEIFETGTMESTIYGTEAANVAKYTKMMQDGVKFDTPYLDYVGGQQEGRHRALAAYNLGIEKIPVVIRDSETSNALTRKQAQRTSSSKRTSSVDDIEELNDELLLEDFEL